MRAKKELDIRLSALIQQSKRKEEQTARQNQIQKLLSSSETEITGLEKSKAPGKRIGKLCKQKAPLCRKVFPAIPKGKHGKGLLFAPQNWNL